MTLNDLLNKTCLIGLTYVDCKGEVLKISQFAGKIKSVDEKKGIDVQLNVNGDLQEESFTLPPGLSAWFKAPEGHYKNTENQVDIKNPDYFVTWDIVKKKDETPEGEHEWWEWHPRVVPPTVN